MKIEQPASLNRFVDRTIPLTWPKRWEIVKPLFPLLIVFAVLTIEMVALRLWMDGRSLRSNWTRLVVTPLPILAVVLGGIELQVRLGHRTKRWLKLDPRRITTQQGWLPWKRLVSWRLEPLPCETNLRKLTLEHVWSRKATRVRSMVLQHPDQTQFLKSEAEHFRQRGITAVPLIELAEPPLSPRRRRVRCLVAFALAYHLFIHGFPILLVGLVGGNKPAESERNTQVHPVGAEKLGRILVKHISSAKELRAGFLLVGGALSGAGMILYAWGIRTAGKADQELTEQEAVARPSWAISSKRG